MKRTIPFGEVLEAADSLSLEEQETLVDILHRRIAERGRKKLSAEIRQARREFSKGGCKRTTPGKLMREILT